MAAVSRGKMRLIHTYEWKWRKPHPKVRLGRTYSGMDSSWSGDSRRVEARRLLERRRGIGRRRATVESNASQMCNQLGKARLNPDLGVLDLGDVSFKSLDASNMNKGQRYQKTKERINVLKTGLSCQSCFSRGFFKEALKASIATASAWRIVGTLATHFLFSASILRGDKLIQKEMGYGMATTYASA